MNKENAMMLLRLLLDREYRHPTCRLEREMAEALRAGIDALKHQPDFQTIGRKGGLATKATHGPEYFRRIGKLGGRPKGKQNDKDQSPTGKSSRS